MTIPHLQISGLSKRFGGLPAISDFSLTVMPGERRLILGPNGAGKTTLFNLISGDLRSDAGSIILFGQEIVHLSTAQRAAMGMGRTYQILTLFHRDSLIHNVALALLGLKALRWSPFVDFSDELDLHVEARKWLEMVGLEGKAEEPVSACSYGEQRRLEIALALAQHPNLLLLDEPLAGLSSQERQQVKSLLEAIPRTVAIVMIEHDMDVALSFAEHISVLNYGKLVVEGTRDDVVADPRTREVYLGN